MTEPTTPAPATKRVTLNARGVERMQEMADAKGISLRELMEALMHHVLSTYERPGSWEANTAFNFDNYRPDGYADKWF